MLTCCCFSLDCLGVQSKDEQIKQKQMFRKWKSTRSFRRWNLHQKCEEEILKNYVGTNRLSYDKSKPPLTRLLTKVISHFAFRIYDAYWHLKIVNLSLDKSKLMHKFVIFYGLKKGRFGSLCCRQSSDIISLFLLHTQYTNFNKNFLSYNFHIFTTNFEWCLI